MDLCLGCIYPYWSKEIERLVEKLVQTESGKHTSAEGEENEREGEKKDVVGPIGEAFFGFGDFPNSASGHMASK